MDFSSLSASRIEAAAHPIEESDANLSGFQWRHGKNRAGHKTSREVIDALLSTVDGDTGDLNENLMNANISFGELASLTREDLNLMGCKDEKQQTSLLDFFRLLPKQELLYQQILESKEAQTVNETILKRAASHLDALRSALVAANYKLKIVPPEDVVVDEKYFASRFVLDALEEMQRVADEIDAELDELEKETKPHKPTGGRGAGKIALNLSIFFTATLGTWLGIWIWKTVKSK